MLQLFIPEHDSWIPASRSLALSGDKFIESFKFCFKLDDCAPFTLPPECRDPATTDLLYHLLIYMLHLSIYLMNQVNIIITFMMANARWLKWMTTF